MRTEIKSLSNGSVAWELWSDAGLEASYVDREALPALVTSDQPWDARAFHYGEVLPSCAVRPGWFTFGSLQGRAS